MKKLLPIMIVCCVAVMSAMAQPQTSNGDNAGGVTASDCEGKSYPSVHFGDVFWMSENLSVEECVNDGNVYVNADAENYGRFYNVNAAMHEGLCPNGWSLPTTDQFEYLKANYTADALRASSGWVVNGSNSTGFSWEASGMHNDVDNRFEKLGVEGYLWAVDMTGGAPQPAMYKMTYYCSEIIRVYDFEDISANVRCVKTSGGDEPGGDEPGSEPTVFKCGVSKMIDAEGHEYETVKMGFLSHGEDLGNYRCWTKTNLRTKKIRPIGSDGLVDLSSASDLLAMGDDYTLLAGMASYSVIPPITTDDGVYHEFPEETYGYLYSYMAAMYACPNGWHLPNFEEWQDLIAYLESKSEQVCGSDNENIAKAMASTDWWGTSDVECAVGNNPALNNASGFSALPAGASFIYIPDDADATVLFQGGGDAAGFWGMLFDLAGFEGALSQHMPVIASLSSDKAKCKLGGDALFSVLVGYSVRCVRDGAADDEPGSDEPGSEPTGFKCGVSKMNDAEGHEYETVKMGFLSQGEDLGNYRCWTKTNLRTKKIRPLGSDGLADLSNASDLLAMGDDYTALAGMASYSVIPPITTDDGVYHEFPEETYGYLYTYMAAMYACPNGWHLPNFEEWQDLITYLESKSEQVCGSDNENIAKAMASTDWWGTSDVECAVGNNPALNNASGFSALPAGAYFIYNPDDADATVLFQGGGDVAGFWGMLFDLAGFDGALSQHMPVIASLSSDRTKCELQGDALFSMLVGYSVRCVRDY